MIERNRELKIINKNIIDIRENKEEGLREKIEAICALSNDLLIIKSGETLSLWNQNLQKHIVKVDMPSRIKYLKLISAKELFCIDRYKTLHILDPMTLKCLSRINGHEKQAVRVDDNLMISFNPDEGSLSVYNNLEYNLELSNDLCRLINLYHAHLLKKIQDNKIVVASSNECLKEFCLLLEWKNNQFVELFRKRYKLEESIYDIIELPNNRLAVCTRAIKFHFSDDFKNSFSIQILDAHTGDTIDTIQLDTAYYFNRIHLLPDERTIVGYADLGKSDFCLIDLETQACEVVKFDRRIQDFTIKPDGKILTILDRNEVAEYDPIKIPVRKCIDNEMKSMLDSAIHPHLSKTILSYVDKDYALSSYSASLFKSVDYSRAKIASEPSETDLEKTAEIDLATPNNSRCSIL